MKKSDSMVLEQHYEELLEDDLIQSQEQMYKYLLRFKRDIGKMKLQVEAIATSLDCQELRNEVKKLHEGLGGILKTLYAYFYSTKYKGTEKLKRDFSKMMADYQDLEKKLHWKVSRASTKIPNKLKSKQKKNLSDEEQTIYKAIQVIDRSDEKLDEIDDQSIEEIQKQVSELTEVLEMLETSTVSQGQMIEDIVLKTDKASNEVQKGAKDIRYSHYLASYGAIGLSILGGAALGGPVGAYVGYSASLPIIGAIAGGVGAGSVAGGVAGFGLNKIRSKISGVHEDISKEVSKKEK